MGRSLFFRIVKKVVARDNYFVQRTEEIVWVDWVQKITAVFRMLAHGCPADATNKYIKIGESTTIESLKRFCRAVVEEFAGSTHFWYDIMNTCIIMHNMIIADELDVDASIEDHMEAPTP
ncbi:hypothetical protein Ddye_015280 [Dipteronia dyeriana]|uniref:Uncharacterized protein n=1 Tax=Dipteronia dyeriana TaxID=168575 RepID=A0AAD9WYC6_9ROSI|nr:hypothetical protein Ddye_015280 [Dipteronia dyeriana]